ncbi:UbiX family flavin prenyltransferase [Paraburkholderia silvatlantica]|uniref:Flavin prenyltransferase UbiX n=1 Tax=Paraburkholderia silvatlantica TaxID=321895 RepID=A0A2U1ABP8_9BURK|nr:UbiX family flavin prenyltransferase [Paraburkholderia silvatlantica]MBB2930300.1 4-hydroxy-3-polyprenylbenzoate decarboxylase [Paraburkholderia silvatlantica]PVY32130.1 4-hydroxy-3-polyprenylbenzoate decarboxylase [Paraburkholderia silvatlantica]PXW37750.1 4-hydroxy-3-polyprenylbenzoate decarboxylase [Paraburkholderia silvatlantica]PYE25571.1 4-hydroxy-3-polyprenylbenzoate decarboxylase [Paraburkholderia silvatlantica]TDQ97786.1 4-hydroxy-3-polyprenylbenzoate decarboxylase [Paraburkholderi
MSTGTSALHEEVRAQEKRVVVAITGATGAVYGVRLLEALRASGVVTHLVVSRAGWMTLADETGLDRAALRDAADVCHDQNEVGASIASGSFQHDGMVVAPCSMKTLAAVAYGFDDNLVARAASVTLKERRKLVLLARETPLTLAHLRNMTLVTEMGAVVMPPMPAFYAKPDGIDAMIDYTVMRVLDQLGIASDKPYARWQGLAASLAAR